MSCRLYSRLHSNINDPLITQSHNLLELSKTLQGCFVNFQKCVFFQEYSGKRTRLASNISTTSFKRAKTSCHISWSGRVKPSNSERWPVQQLIGVGETLLIAVVFYSLKYMQGCRSLSQVYLQHFSVTFLNIPKKHIFESSQNNLAMFC